MTIQTPSRDNHEELFRLRTKIVGKQYYRENLSDGDLVYLIRNPYNSHDCNAIKVISINHQQVVHIFAALYNPNVAACLAPILDYSLDTTRPRMVGAFAEAISVGGACSVYFSYCMITLVGDPVYHEIIKQHLLRHHLPHEDLKHNRDMEIQASNDIQDLFSNIRISVISPTVEEISTANTNAATTTVLVATTIVGEEEATEIEPIQSN